MSEFSGHSSCFMESAPPKLNVKALRRGGCEACSVLRSDVFSGSPALLTRLIVFASQRF